MNNELDYYKKLKEELNSLEGKEQNLKAIEKIEDKKLERKIKTIIFTGLLAGGSSILAANNPEMFNAIPLWLSTLCVGTIEGLTFYNETKYDYPKIDKEERLLLIQKLKNKSIDRTDLANELSKIKQAKETLNLETSYKSK